MRVALLEAGAGEAAGALPAVNGAEAGLERREGCGAAIYLLNGDIPVGLCQEVKVWLACGKAGGGAVVAAGHWLEGWLLGSASCLLTLAGAAGCKRRRFEVASCVSIKSKMSEDRLRGQGRCSAAFIAWLGHERGFQG